MSSLKDKEFQMVGCLGKHASYTFYKSIRIGERILSLASFFPVRIWPDSAILSIAEVQLLWKDRNECLCSLRLYFLPENTPFGRFSFHGEDEVIALQDKVIIRASDLMTWIVDEGDWDWGFVTPFIKQEKQNNILSKAFMSEKYLKDEKYMEFIEPRSNSVVVMNYERYVRLRSVLKRLEGSPDSLSWFKHPLVMAIGGLALGPNCRILFAREVFDHPELDDHELLCNHLAPKLKGRPRKQRRTRNPSMGSVSNESESSSTGSCGSTDKGKQRKPLNGMSAHPNVDKDIRIPTVPLARAAKMLEEEGPEGVHKELIFGSNSNGLQILKVDSSQLKNGQISGHDGNSGVTCGGSFVKRSYNQVGSNKRGTCGATGSAMNILDAKPHMLGPGLSELAQKLKRSNALQILAIQPPHGSGRDVGLEYDLHQLKRMKMDPNMKQPARINSDLFIDPLNTGPYTSRKHTIYCAPMIDKVISKTHEVVKHVVGSTHSQKSTTGFKIPAIPPKPQKQPVVTSQIDAEAKVITAKPGYTNSPYKAQNQLYWNVAAERLEYSDGAPAPLTSKDPLDYSVRKRHLPSQPIRRNPAPVQTPETDLLDLTIRPSSSSGRHNLYSRSMTDIPPPNAMDKLGLQLTSEVTLFPSHPLMGKVKEASHSKPAQLSKSSATAVSSNKHQDSIPGTSRKPIRSPSTSNIMHGASGVNAVGSGSSKEIPMRHHSQHHYPNHLNTKSMFGAPDRSIIPGLSPSQGHSGSAITIKPMTADEKYAAKINEQFEKVYQSIPGPQFLTPSSYVPKVDPAYLSLLTNPFLMNPQTLMSIPGAMEQFQMYKDLFQQSGIPQFPLQWPPQGPGNDRASK
ncbi:unnamed protein product [Orchesella dallaii]|uniref:AT-rich interactive domain-containing protein 5B n=1 Tax=Orchesella dallaii TaxID=48710 RepID=A0ABP1R2D5_9HEXA